MSNEPPGWPATLSETEHTPESLINALGLIDEIPAAEIAIATLYAPEIEPSIVELIELARRSELDDHEEMALFRGIHVLGGRRLTAAYRPLIGLLRELDSKRAERLLGDGITETLSAILAGLYDGDPGPLLSLITDQGGDEFIREAGIKTLAFLTFEARIDRAFTESFLDEFERTDKSPAGSMVWHGWMTAVGVLGMEHMRSRVEAAFRDGRIPRDVVDEDDFSQIIDAALKSPSDPSRMERERLGYIEDVLDELSRFTAASAHGENTASWEDDDWLLDEFNVHEPYRNPFKDVGRNDPCPCGSGAKFKKCCGG